MFSFFAVLCLIISDIEVGRGVVALVSGSKLVTMIVDLTGSRLETLSLSGYPGITNVALNTTVY